MLPSEHILKFVLKNEAYLIKGEQRKTNEKIALAETNLETCRNTCEEKTLLACEDHRKAADTCGRALHPLSLWTCEVSLA